MVKLELIKSLIIGGFAYYCLINLGETFGFDVRIFDLQYVLLLVGIGGFAAYLYTST